MKKLFFVLALVLGFAWSAFSAEPEKVYGVERGHIAYKMSVLGFEVGTVDILFDDFGRKCHVETFVSFGGEEKKVIIIQDGVRQATYEVKDGKMELDEITEAQGTEYSAYSQVANLSEEELRNQGVEVCPEEEYMGYTTKVYKIKTKTEEGREVTAVINLWNSIPMKVGAEVGGMKMDVLSLTSLETDIEVDPSLFVIPEEEQA